MKPLIFGISALFITVTALPLWQTPYWWVRMYDFPRAQLTVFGVVLIVAMLTITRPQSRWGWGLFALLIAATLYQTFSMVPYTPFYPVQVQDALAKDAPQPSEEARGEEIKLLVSNVLIRNRQSDAWLRMVRQANPDIILAVETDAWWAAQLEPLHADYPHRLEVPQDNTYGMILMSRWPLKEAKVRHLVEETVPSIWATIATPAGAEIKLIGLHPRPPRPDTQQHSDLRDAELIKVAREVSSWQDDTPVIVAGDLNDVAWSASTRLFQRLSGLLDPRIGRGRYSTYHAQYPVLRWPLDHIYHSEHFLLGGLELLDPCGSDHFPVSITLALRPAVAPILQDQPEPQEGDEDQARDVLKDRHEREREETREDLEERDAHDR